MVTGYLRGNPIEYLNNVWVYSSDKMPIDREERKCTRCSCFPTKEGYDACLGHLEGISHACCGHGVEDGYIIYESGEVKILKNKQNS